MEGISYADQSSEEPSEKSDNCTTLTEEMRYTISFDPSALDSTPSESEKSTSYSINEEILISQCREFMAKRNSGGSGSLFNEQRSDSLSFSSQK